MATNLPPAKKPRRSPQSLKNDRPKQQLTLAQTLKRKQSIDRNQGSQEVIILDSESETKQDKERFEHSPELFSDMSNSPPPDQDEHSSSLPKNKTDSGATAIVVVDDDGFHTSSRLPSHVVPSSSTLAHEDATVEYSVASEATQSPISRFSESSDHSERRAKSLPPLSDSQHSPIPDFHSDSRSHTSSRDSTPSDTTTPSTGGTQLNEISHGPSTYPILPPLQPSASHAILFRPRLKHGHLPRPFPDKFKDTWDQNHVRMPCSSQSVYPVPVGDDSREKKLLPRWEMIEQALSVPVTNSYDLEQAILSYNSRYSKKWNFNSLHRYFDEICTEEESGTFFSVILPKIISLALDLPKIVTHAVPLLKCQEEYAITLSQQQVASLLANAFLCTFPRRNALVSTSEFGSYPSINFNTLYQGGARGPIPPVKANKLKSILHYFTRVTSKMPEGTITFKRLVLTTPPKWDKSDVTITSLHVDCRGTIEDNGHGMLQVDFANKFLGGGVLSQGCVQEEIRFLICPELILSRLFTEKLDNNECLVMTGAEQYSEYRGYGRTFEWTGSHDDQTERDRWGRRQTEIVAMDALVFHSYMAQLKPGALCRELNKAYCGFRDSTPHPTPSGRSMAVATGNWGCGAFGGDTRLKALLQLMAASEAKRDVVYYTFGDVQLKRELCTLYSTLVDHSVNVGQLWTFILQYHSSLRDKKRSSTPQPSLYQFITSKLLAPKPSIT